MTPKELRARTHAFAVTIHAFCQPLLRRLETREAAEQLLDASSSVGSNEATQLAAIFGQSAKTARLNEQARRAAKRRPKKRRDKRS